MTYDDTLIAVSLIGFFAVIGGAVAMLTHIDSTLGEDERPTIHALCPRTGRTFCADEVVGAGVEGFGWVACPVCDTHGRIIGDLGFDPTNPAIHCVKTETAHMRV